MKKKIVSFIFQRMTMSRVLIMNLHSVRGEVRKFTRNWVFPGNLTYMNKVEKLNYRCAILTSRFVFLESLWYIPLIRHTFKMLKKEIKIKTTYKTKVKSPGLFFCH